MTLPNDEPNEDQEPPRCPPHYCDNQGLCHYCGIIMEPSWWAAYNGEGDDDAA